MKKTLLKILLMFVLWFVVWWAVSASFLHAARKYPCECLSQSCWMAGVLAVFTGLLCLLVWDAGRHIGDDCGPNGG
jgi:flagellar biosynthesis protein FlhB